jgi:peptidoglycan/LPS O-acetylase OafA/YrhL
MAVKLFFFLSGLLVTNSLLEKRSVAQFVVARFFRIMPALALVLVCSAFLIGPAFTSLDLRSYFSDPNTYLYVKRQLLMESWGTHSLGYYNLPGVFADNPYSNDVNASLWSLVVEVYAYLLLAGAFLVGFAERRMATMLLLLVLMDSILPSRILFPFLPKGNEDFSYLPFCFGAGMLFALYKDRIRISLGLPLGFLLLLFLFSGTSYSRYFFYLVAFTGVLYLATCRWVINLRLPADVSYGVFLWGFPIQQSLVHIIPNITLVSNQVLATVLALGFGTASWFLVEKRAIAFGRRISRNLGAPRPEPRSADEPLPRSP